MVWEGLNELTGHGEAAGLLIWPFCFWGGVGPSKSPPETELQSEKLLSAGWPSNHLLFPPISSTVQQPFKSHAYFTAIQV